MICTRCGRALGAPCSAWNIRIEAGRIVDLVCPHCQTTDEHIESTIVDATSTWNRDQDGLLVQHPKGDQT